MGKVLLLFALLLGSLCLLGAGLEAHRLRWEATWPTTVGVVNDSRLFEGDESAWVEVRYTYEVGGARITKTGNVDIPNTRAIPDGYRPETEVTVHYHPTIPDRSYLRHAGYSSPIALAVMGAVVWLVCLPFVAWQMLMWHVDRNVRKAKYHYEKAYEAVQEAQQELDALTVRGERIPPALFERHVHLLESTEQAYATLKDLDGRWKSFKNR